MHNRHFSISLLVAQNTHFIPHPLANPDILLTSSAESVRFFFSIIDKMHTKHEKYVHYLHQHHHRQLQHQQQQ